MGFISQKYSLFFYSVLKRGWTVPEYLINHILNKQFDILNGILVVFGFSDRTLIDYVYMDSGNLITDLTLNTTVF